nr:hypothetical protein [Tanacetum cinerariifolium]
MLGVSMGNKDLEERPYKDPFIKDWEDQYFHLEKPTSPAISFEICSTSEADFMFKINSLTLFATAILGFNILPRPSNFASLTRTKKLENSNYEKEDHNGNNKEMLGQAGTSRRNEKENEKETEKENEGEKENGSRDEDGEKDELAGENEEGVADNEIEKENDKGNADVVSMEIKIVDRLDKEEKEVEIVKKKRVKVEKEVKNQGNNDQGYKNLTQDEFWDIAFENDEIFDKVVNDSREKRDNHKKQEKINDTIDILSRYGFKPIGKKNHVVEQ